MAQMISYSLENIDLYRIPMDVEFNEPAGLVGRWMARRGRIATAYAKGRVGVRTGRLKSSIRMAHDRKAPGRGQQIRIQAGTKTGNRGYALMHHTGTAPHVIRAKAGRTMSFTVRGRRVHTRLVRHPGTRPNHYLTDTFKVFMP